MGCAMNDDDTARTFGVVVILHAVSPVKYSTVTVIKRFCAISSTHSTYFVHDLLSLDYGTTHSRTCSKVQYRKGFFKHRPLERSASFSGSAVVVRILEHVM